MSITTESGPRATPGTPIRRWRAAAVVVLVIVAMGFTAVRTNVLGAGDRFDRLLARIELALDPPNGPTVVTVEVPAAPSPSAPGQSAPAPSGSPTSDDPSPSETPPPGEPTDRPAPIPPAEPVARVPVDVQIVPDPDAVFASEVTNEMCAPAATQIVLAILGLADNSEEFQLELESRIDEWSSWEDSHDGGWGPGAVSLALAAYGAPGYELRAYESHLDALRDSAIAISSTRKPVVLFPWWGAHAWVMSGYRADADPAIFSDAKISGAYIFDPWYPRVSSIWGESNEPGTFESLAELERNWPVGTPMGHGPGWDRPEGTYPERDFRYVVLIPRS